MTTAKRIGWALVTATAAVTGVGAYMPELGIAISSVFLGGLALAVSLVARGRSARYPSIPSRIEMQPETVA